MYGKLLIPLMLLTAIAAAQDLQQFSPFASHRYAAVSAPAPDFSAQAFRATDLRAIRPGAPLYWDALTPLPQANQPRPLNIPMLKTLQRNRMVAMLAGGVPKLADMFDEDSVPKHRIAVSPMLDLDGGIGVRVKIRLQ
jgi:hypothetical protein